MPAHGSAHGSARSSARSSTKALQSSSKSSTKSPTKISARSSTRSPIPSAGSVLREADRARTSESKVRVWSGSLDPIDSIGQLLSIIVGQNVLAEGIAPIWN
jgi:hypothetical protein